MFLFIYFLSLCTAEQKNYTKYVQQFYGPKFEVDFNYPTQIVHSDYCNINTHVEFDTTHYHNQYPPNLWLALIHTVPTKLDHVENTRNTWCQPSLQQKYGFKCIFIMVESTVQKLNKSQEILEMNQTHHDIYFIQMPDLREHWFTLQQKNINSYILALDVFPGYYYYSRVDDQIMVTVDLLSNFFMEHLNNATVIGDICKHRPVRNKNNKYFDPLARPFPKYYPFPSGYLSLFSRDIIEYIADWKNYYSFAPSSLEDPGFGQWIYKYSQHKGIKIDILTPIGWGGNVRNTTKDYIVYHNQRGKLNQTEIYHQQLSRGYMKSY